MNLANKKNNSTGSYLYALPEVINRKKANKENGRINHAKHSLIGVWQISYTAGEKVNAYNGAGKDGPAPLYLKWSFPRYRFKMLSSTCLMNSSWGHDDSSWVTPILTITMSRDGMTATT